MSYVNADGLEILTPADAGNVVKYGSPYDGTSQTLVWEVNWDDTTGIQDKDRLKGHENYIPAGAWIKSATFIVSEDWATSDSAVLSLGLAQKDGTVIDADGIDATIASTALDLGDVVLCDGALVGGTVYIGTTNAYVYATIGTGSFTTGVGKLIIEYYI